MLPTASLCAIAAQSAGVGGAALLSPIFTLGFAALGPEYQLSSPAMAFGAALFTETCGFSSGLVGYTKQGLVDRDVAVSYALAGAPFAIAGGFLGPRLDPSALRLGYGCLMMLLGGVLAFPPETSDDCEVLPDTRTLQSAGGETYVYLPPSVDLSSGVLTAAGALLTGMLSVGIGEVLVPQVLSPRRLPVCRRPP